MGDELTLPDDVATQVRDWAGRSGEDPIGFLRRLFSSELNRPCPVSGCPEFRHARTAFCFDHHLTWLASDQRKGLEESFMAMRQQHQEAFAATQAEKPIAKADHRTPLPDDR